MTFRILASLEDSWDWWLGDLALKGVDPRRWDLKQLLAAYEVTLQQGCKDQAEWQRTRAKLYAEPKEVRQERAAEAKATGARRKPPRAAMSLDSVEAMLGAAAARDAQYK